MSVKVLQIHKRDSIEFTRVQDKYFVSEDHKTIIVADGSSQSFMSEIWADDVIQSLNRTQDWSNIQKVVKNLQESARSFNLKEFPLSNNLAKASLQLSKKQKGGTTSFCGVRFVGNQIEVLSCGDCNLFKLTNDYEFKSLLFDKLDDLNKSTTFINSIRILSDEFDTSIIKYETFSVNDGDQLFLTTDAVARMAFVSSKYVMTLIESKNFEDFLSHILVYWENRVIEEDDLTLVHLKVDGKNELKSIIPREDFQFELPKTPEFSINYNFESSGDEIMANEKLDRLSIMIDELKSDLRLVKLLLIIITGLVLVLISLATIRLVAEQNIFNSKLTVDHSESSIFKPDLSPNNTQNAVDSISVQDTLNLVDIDSVKSD